MLFILPLNLLFGQSMVDYRRSSLTMILIENENLGNRKDLVVDSYYSNPFPENYNNHLISNKTFNPQNIKLTKEDFVSSGFYIDTLKSPKDFLKALKNPLNKLRYLNSENTIAVIEPTSEELNNIYIQKYIKEKKLAKQIVSSWFNLQPNGEYNWDLIKQRGLYSASAEAKDVASSAANNVDYLMDFELIGNTYTLFNKMNFIENEPLARSIRDNARLAADKKFAGKPEILIKKAYEAIDAVYEKTKEGYTVICSSYLYQLEWNDSIANLAKKQIFNESKVNTTLWDTTNLFKMKFLGKTTVSSLVTFKFGEKRTEEQVIELQIKRTIDNVLSKLQKEYIQFRPVAPISSVNPLTARIGLKEGLEPGQKFEVLEQSYNALGMPFWKSIEKVSVDKKTPIWDNTQGAEVKLDENGNELPVQEFTTFIGGKNAQVGLNYIRLTK